MAVGRAALPALKKAQPGAAAEAIVGTVRLLIEWAIRVGAKPAAPIAR